MADAPVTVKRKRGRPRKFTVDEARRYRKEDIKRYRVTMVALSSAYGAWNELRNRGKWTHGQLALHLLDVHAKACKQPNCQVPGHLTEQDAGEVKGTGTDELRQLNENGKRFKDSRGPDTSKSVDSKTYVRILPKPVTNQNGVSIGTTNIRHEKQFNQNVVLVPGRDDAARRDVASLPVHTVAGGQDEIICKDDEEEQRQAEKEEREYDEGLGTSQGEVELKESTNEEDFLKFSENLEPNETDLDDASGLDQKEHENDSENGEEPGIAIIFDGDEDGFSSGEEEDFKEKRPKLDDQVTDLPFKKFNLAEVAKAEGIPHDGNIKNKIRKLNWTELERTYRCRMCPFEDSCAYRTCRHLLQEHPGVVIELEEYLIGKPVSDSEPGRTLYEKVMEVLPPSNSIIEDDEGSECHDGEEEESGFAEIKKGGSKTSASGGKETKDNPLDSKESLELLSKWVKLKINCQFCQKVISCVLFKPNGQRITHKCKFGNCVTSLCEICGKLISNIRLHWLSAHSKRELRICPYCGVMKTASALSVHICNCHSGRKEENKCGVCNKGFKNKGALSKHMVTHRKEKPFQCEYCQRGFTQSTNMKNHMRQHTGEKPYQCNLCPESFAHNVSRKNHLKSKHGIDPWKMDEAGDREPSSRSIPPQTMEYISNQY